MRKDLLSFIFLLSLLPACEKKEQKESSPEFAKESPGYTTDRSVNRSNPIRFADITREAGIDFVHTNGAFGEKWMPETLGSGGGFLDYDNDGWPDIFLVNSAEWEGHESKKIKPTPGLFRNRGNGYFEDVTKEAGLSFTLYGMGSSFADFDADGDMDIFITAVGKNVLLQNDNGRFSDITKKTGIDENKEPVWSTGSAWVDVDRDGWLDLFVANYVDWTPETDIYVTRDGKTKSYATPQVYEGVSCRLYQNIGGTRFRDITEEAGVLNNEGKSLGVAISDFNRDSWPDIVVSNDTQPNFLYMNNGDGTFSDMAVRMGIGYDERGRARAGMGIDVADVWNDNKLAIAIGNFSHEPLSLYTQVRKGAVFQDQAGAARLNRPSLLQLSFGLKFTDLDLDGYLDLVVANGHIEPEINAVEKHITFEQNLQVFHNNKGQYIDISDQVGESFAEPIVGRGVATGDIDKDGDNDLLITVNGGPPRLFRNDTEARGNQIQIKLSGDPPNLQAIGAMVYVWADSVRQQQMVRTGSSYLTQSDVSTLIFGLGDRDKADSIFVYWPTSGDTSKYVNLASGGTYVFEESD